MISRVFCKQVFNFRFSGQITCSLHIQNLSKCCRHNYEPVNFTDFLYSEFHFWLRRVLDIWSNCGGALMHNLSQVSSSTLGSQKAMFLHDEAIIMYLGAIHILRKHFFDQPQTFHEFFEQLLSSLNEY